MSINLAGLCGIHPIVSGAIVLVLFTGIPTGLADVILMQAMLVGWGLCSSISIGSLSIAAGAAMFDLSPEGLVYARQSGFRFDRVHPDRRPPVAPEWGVDRLGRRVTMLTQLRSGS